MPRIMGQEGQFLQWAGFAGIAPRAVFLPFVFKPQMLVIMAGMDQKERYMRRAENCGNSAVAVHQGRCFPVVTPRLIPMVLLTTEIPQWLFDTVVNALILQVVQIFRRGAERDSAVLLR